MNFESQCDFFRTLQIVLTKRLCDVIHKDANDVHLKYLKKRGYHFIDLLEKADTIASQINAKTPLFFGRMGSTEASIVYQYLQKRANFKKQYTKEGLNALLSTSGFFLKEPENVEEQVDEYAQLLISCFDSCDYMSTTWPPMQVMMLSYLKYLRGSTIVCNKDKRFNDFGPYPILPTDQTWLKALEGKNVLIVTSFPDSVKKQYARRGMVSYNAACVLPDFNLITYKTFSTQFGAKPDGYDTFYQVLQKMTDDIANIDFDVAIVGAGAYGFPLSCNIKKTGKIAIETCGCTPLFFGIYGERQLTDNLTYKPYINENWIRPMEEPPKRYKEIENGCYW